MGILNVTPDSFSDGGAHFGLDEAVARGLAMAAEGADVIDVGGESTRPGSSPVSVEEELRRVLPVVRLLRERLDACAAGSAGSHPEESLGGAESSAGEAHATEARASEDGFLSERVRISIDTTKAAVAEAALEAGAEIVNDVSGLRADPAMAPLLGARGAAAVLMHMRGTPATMQSHAAYEDLMGEIAVELRESLAIARRANVSDGKIVLDPGLGFAKTAAQSFAVLASLDRLLTLGRPLLVGASRKSFLGHATGLAVDQRLEASLAA